MNLLILLAQRHWTGPAESVLQIAGGLNKRGHQVTFIFTRHPAGSLIEKIDHSLVITVPEIIVPRKGFHPLTLISDLGKLRRLVRGKNIDAIFCHHSHDHWLALSIRGARRKRPILVRQIHESRQLRPQVNYRFLYRSSDALVVAAETWRQKLIDNFQIAPEQVAVIEAGVDTERFNDTADAAAIRTEIGAGPEDKLIGMVSRIKPGRGHHLALDAFTLLRRDLPKAHLLFIGRGEGQGALEEDVARRELAAQVHFLGYRSTDLPALYRAMDTHLLLGEGSDGSGRAALEAMSCGTPVIALSVGAVTQSITNGRTGFIVESSPAAIVQGIMEVLRHPEMRVNARRKAESDFSIANRVNLAEALFLRLLEQR